MYNLELEGTLMKILPAQRGTSARGEWVKQEFLVEYQDGRFPVTAVFSVWGQDKVDELASFSVGDLVSVAFKVSSREYAGKYYTDLRAWKIGRANAGSGAEVPARPEQTAYQQSAPAGFRSAPAPVADDYSSPADSDDLPF